ncbi:MAG: hypothetical protein UT32_C0013G0023 [Parcubacteria group bacterium GW2011_GWC2_39_14]|nr:MAG: hypothetical protein UT32_C0013G0023 [Parcubacteria group bacterium GW2011_GWC2_39_14]KKR54511.1 MAG: hypothetical protein UT91_C0014G0023 [Parcubacteria group bacterium GW2011_GWA2_40_23]
MAIRAVESGDYDVLRQIAVERLQPLYGDQSKALNEWMTGAGLKKAYVIVSDSGQVAGLLSLKVRDDLSYLKISTLLVLLEHKGVGHGPALLSFSEVFAREHSYRALLVTVSENKPESLAFFKSTDSISLTSKLVSISLGLLNMF